jgi:hypothetical protein
VPYADYFRKRPKSVKGKDTLVLSKNRNLIKASILVGAAISFFLSIFLWFSGSKDQGIFVGIWVPSILSFGALIFAGETRNE